MTKVLVLGASGQIARHVVSLLESDADVQLTLFVRHPRKLTHTPANARIAQGDVLDAVQLGGAMQGQDIVYANLTGEDLDAQARSVIASMQAMGVKRLIFVLSLGIYDEVPGKFGEWNNATIGPLLPNKPRSVPLATIARCSTVSTGACARAFPEPTFPSATGRQPLATIASFGGANSASGTGFLKRSQKRTTAICRWSVLRPFACTSTPSTSKKVGRSANLKLIEGHAHDGRSAAVLVATLESGRILITDRAYDSAAPEPHRARRMGQRQADLAAQGGAGVQRLSLSLS